MNIDTAKIAILKVKTGVLSVVGWILAIFFGAIFMTFALDIENTVDIALTVVFAIVTLLGAWLIYDGFRKRKLIKIYNDYSARFADNSDGLLDLLAHDTNSTVEEVIKNINDIIALGLFTNCYLDTIGKRLVIPREKKVESEPDTQKENPKDKLKYVVVECSECGAKNKIPAGFVKECEYCGSRISSHKDA